MIPLPLAWTLLTISLWTLGSSQILQQETDKCLYPKISSTQAIECDCPDSSCDSVYWFRSISSNRKMQFLGKCNNAERFEHGDGVDKLRFVLSKKSTMSFMLRIINVTEEDAGFYSCIVKDRKNMETWMPGIRLQPGVMPPTVPPKPKLKPPVKSSCNCPKTSKGNVKYACSSQILLPLVGLIAALTLALICTLYYFSRLPKKCRHRFVKKR